MATPSTDNGRTFLQYRFDPARADRAVRFIESCCILSKGADSGKPLRLRPFQRHIVRELFGWIDPATGLRRYRKAFIFLPRKNGKSNLCAAIASYMLFADHEPGAEVILAANSRDQASIVYNAVAGMIRQSPALKPLAMVVPSTKRVVLRDSGSVLKAISADAPTALGLDISCLIYDEIAFAPNRDLYDALTTATGSRRQPLELHITTAGWDHQGVGYQLYQYAKLVQAKPETDPTFLPIIYEIGEKDDWTDPANWHKANPALGDFLNLTTLENEAREAQNKPTEQGKFRMFHCNQWVQAAESWLDANQWMSCHDRDFDEASLKGAPCYLGLDLSSKVDLTALVACFVLPSGNLYFKPWFFLPEHDLRGRVLRDHVPYDAWVEQERITLTPGATIDYEFVRAKVNQLAKLYNVQALGFDPWQSRQIITELEQDGLKCIEIRQGPQSLAAPTKEFESLIVGQKLGHDDNPCMGWQISNVAIRMDQNQNPVPDKQKSRHRIDGVVAAIMALHCQMRLAMEAKPATPTFRITVLG